MKASHKPKDPIERARLVKTRVKRAKAREKIVQAANRYKIENSPRRAPVLFGPRDIGTCVSVCRRFGLVDADTLTAAGFNPRPTGKPHVAVGVRRRRLAKVRAILPRARRRAA